MEVEALQDMLERDEPVTLLDVRETGEFVARLLDRIPATPPNHLRIVELNEASQMPDGDVTELETGANRCAAG